MQLDKITQAPPMPPAIRRMLDHLAKVVIALLFKFYFTSLVLLIDFTFTIYLHWFLIIR